MVRQDVNNSDTILRFRAGEPYIFALIFHQFYLDLSLFAKRILDKPRMAEQIVEEAFIELWKGHKTFESIAAVKSFLYHATRDACFQFMDDMQEGIKDVDLSAYMWQETTVYMEKEILRPDAPRKVSYNLIENLPAACRKELDQYTANPRQDNQ